MDTPERQLDRRLAANMAIAETDRACAKYPKFNSTHEGYAVILEEVDEAWQSIKENDRQNAVVEMVQVAAMAIRFIAEFGDVS